MPRCDMMNDEKNWPWRVVIKIARDVNRCSSNVSQTANVHIGKEFYEDRLPHIPNSKILTIKATVRFTRVALSSGI